MSGGSLGAKGLLVNPNLRTLNSVKGELGLNTTQLRTLETFVDNIKKNLFHKQY